jgi:hypothetical protein
MTMKYSITLQFDKDDNRVYDVEAETEQDAIAEVRLLEQEGTIVDVDVEELDIDGSDTYLLGC